VSFSLDATDGPDGTGVAHTYYSLNGGDAVTYSGTAVPVSAEGTTTVSYWSVDKAGNTEGPAKSATILIDTAKPDVTGAANPAPNSAGWNNSNVTVHFSATDALSGVRSVSPDVVLSGEAANQSAQGSATDNAGNSASVTVGHISIDKTPPAVSISSPASGVTYYLHQSATVAWTVTDALSGLATTSATVANGAALDTSVAGARTVTVTATDVAGNPVTKTVTYMVVTPKQLFGDLLAFFDASLANKTLAGTGSCPKVSAQAERVLIVLASDCYDAYVKTGKRVWLTASIDAMQLVYGGCDGSAPDLVTGSSRAELAARAVALKVALGKQ
jgi:hypothetical protein